MSTPRTNINRLLRLAGLLRDLPPKNFDIGSWAEESAPPPKAKCGMTCCIGGWATVIHPDLTLSLSGGLRINGSYSGGSGHKSFAKAFGLSNDAAYPLTDGDASHRTPKAAARAVEKVAADLAEEHGYEIVET